MKKLLFLLLFISGIAYSQVYEKTTAVGLDSSVTKPSAVAKYGWVYRGTDNHLYWRTLNGTRMLDSSTSITIDSTNWQKYPDTLTWDATKKNLKDSTASLRTDLYRKSTQVTDSTNARNYSNSLYLKNADSTTLKNSINVAGTLSNVAYLNQVNRFSDMQRIAGTGSVSKGLLLSNANNTYHNLINVVDSSIYFSTKATDTTTGNGGTTRLKINTNGITTSAILPFSNVTYDIGATSNSYKMLYVKDITMGNNLVGTATTFTGGDGQVTYNGDFISNTYGTLTNFNGLAYWNSAGKIDSIGNVATGALLQSTGTGANKPTYLPLGSSGTVLSSMAGQTVPTYNSKVFLYPSDSAFIVTSSIKNKNVASYVQQGDTSAYVIDFTTGTGKPQMRIKDPTGATTLYIDSTGQINGSEVANGDLTLQGTTHATRTSSYINIQPNGGSVNIGTTTSVGGQLTLSSTSSNDAAIYLQETATNRSTLVGFQPTGALSATNPQWAMGTLYNDANNGYHFLTWDGSTARDRFSIDTASNLTYVGKIVTYNNIALKNNGVASEIVDSNRTGQSAAIGATTLYAVPASGAGKYRVTYTATITTAASTSSVLGGTNGFQVVYTNNGGDNVVKTSVAGNSIMSTANTTGTMVTGSFMVYCKASTNLQYKFDYTSVGATAMVYDLSIIVEKL